jgi:hypothetical protein
MDLPRRLEDYPEAVQLLLIDLYQRAVSRLTEVVERHGLNPGLCLALARERIALLAEATEPVVTAMAAAATPVACARGCGWCCTLTIQASPDEVFALISHLAESLAPEDLAALQARALAADARGHGHAPSARHSLRIFCPVLDPASHDCLGHVARPGGCQGYLSLDLAQCRADHALPSQPIAQPAAAALLRDTVAAARDTVLERAGARLQSLELTAALVAAWADPDAETRWLGGSPVLETATSIDNPLGTTARVPPDEARRTPLASSGSTDFKTPGGAMHRARRRSSWPPAGS